MPTFTAVSLRLCLFACSLAALTGCEQASPPPSALAPTTAPTAAPPTPAPEPAADQPALDDPAVFLRYGQAEPNPRTPGSIRLATYNIENLFDDVDDPALTDRDDDAGMTKPEANRIAAADALRRIDADIVALQEVESESALRWFLDAHASDLGYEHVLSLDAGDNRGIEQAIISRFPLSNPRQWINEPLGGIHPDLYGTQPNWEAGKPILFRRSPLAADVTLPGGEMLTLITVHHKSGRHAGYWREAEARRVVSIAAEIEAQHPGRSVIILGDFNATPDDASVKMYLEPGRLDAGAAAPAAPTEPWQCVFARSTRSGPEIITHASGRRIDLILANPAAARWLVPESPFVLGTTAAPEGVGFDDARYLPGYASDHYPVVIDLKP